MKNLGDSWGQQGGNYKWGDGAFIRQLPQLNTAKWNEFGGGYDASQEAQEIGANASPWSINTYVDRKDRIARCPGTALVEDITPHTPKQIALHPDLSLRTEMVLFDAPNIGVRAEGATVWYDIGLPAVTNDFDWTVYGSDLLFLNGVGSVYKRIPGQAGADAMPGIPNGSAIATFATRVLVGGAIIDGSFEPLGIRWPTIQGNYDYEGDTSGFELLISNDTQLGDRIVAMRPMGFDYLAILCRHSIWIGRRTQDAYRPVDFVPRVTGKGCVNAKTAQITNGGVMFLTDEGVEIFDGNSSTPISAQIDPEILSLDPATIAQFSSAYNPHTQFYYLFTPGYTYVYDCLRKRWHRRDMTVLAGTPFALQFHATTWTEISGTWGGQVTQTWADYLPRESSIPDMMFLGDDVVSHRVIHKEQDLADSMLGKAVSFLWGSPLGEFQRNIFLATHKTIRLRYEGTGIVKYLLPDNHAAFENVGQISLLAESFPDVAQSNGIHTGLGVGIQLQITSGDPRIASVELDYLQRGPRIESGYRFTPREYQADF